MPELPEVELYRRSFEEVALNQVIVDIRTENEGRMLPGGLEALREAAIGQQMVTTERIGKYFFIRLSNDQWVMWHFGLTGSFTYYQDVEMQHRFARIFFDFDNGWHLSFNSMRKFSRMEVTESLEAYRKKKKIGPDVGQIKHEEFSAALQKRGAPIKVALLEQKKFAGIGNWMADEMLHRHKIHPETRCHEIGEQTYHQLLDSVRDIIDVTLDYEADYENFPEHFLVRVREPGGHCPRCAQELARIVVGGRGTYICEKCQVATEGT